MLVSFFLSLLLRLFFRRDSLPPSKGLALLYASTFVPTLFLYRYLSTIGRSKRDPTTGALISSGEDLNQTGTTEWCFDILYITCEPKISEIDFRLIEFRGLPGRECYHRRVVLVVLLDRESDHCPFILLKQIPGQIPGYAIFKMWSLLSPALLGTSKQSESDKKEQEPVSKRQQKLKARQEKGDPRVKTVQRK